MWGFLSVLALGIDGYCKNVMNNGEYSGFTVKKAWWAGQRHEFDGLVTIPLGGEKIRDWTIQVTFVSPTEVDEIWEATPWKTDHEGRIWHFTTRNNNYELTGTFQFNFLAGMYNYEISGDVIYCTDNDKPGNENPTNPPTDPNPTDPNPTNPNPTDPGPTEPWPTDDPGLCQGPTGRNVQWSSQSDVGGYIPAGGRYDYAEVLHKSIMFYEAQRAGKQPSNNRINWRGDAALHDGCDVGRSMQKGWFDAGDHVKFNFPMAFSATMLGWGLIDHKEGYIRAGEYNRALDSIRWAFDYLMACHPEKYTVHMQVGDGHADHGFWGRPEEMSMYRPIFTLNRSRSYFYINHVMWSICGLISCGPYDMDYKICLILNRYKKCSRI